MCICFFTWNLTSIWNISVDLNSKEIYPGSPVPSCPSPAWNHALQPHCAVHIKYSWWATPQVSTSQSNTIPLFQPSQQRRSLLSCWCGSQGWRTIPTSISIHLHVGVETIRVIVHADSSTEPQTGKALSEITRLPT